jgi:hypothetical protein
MMQALGAKIDISNLQEWIFEGGGRNASDKLEKTQKSPRSGIATGTLSEKVK